MRRFSYSVSEKGVSSFVEANRCVQDFLNRYEQGGVTHQEKTIGLARFFRWLKVIKRLDLSPSEFLNLRARAVEEEGGVD